LSGAGIASFAMGIANRVTISDLQSITDKHDQQIIILEERINVTQQAVKRLQLDFNSLVDDYSKHKDDFMELKDTLPCIAECPIELATPKGCFLHSDFKDLYIRFDIPKINPTLQIVEADPFKLVSVQKTRLV